jgi:predicted transcriptional regulator
MRQRNAPFLVRFEDTIIEKLKHIAKEEGRTITEIIREAVAELIRDRERTTPRRQNSF